MLKKSRHSPRWKYEVVRESMVGTVYRCPRCGEVDTWLILRESRWCIPLEYQIGSSEVEMPENSKIAWTNHTWNPVSGCTQVSPGCDNCYALTLAERIPWHSRHFPNGFDITLRPHKLGEPLRYKEPSLVFVNSHV